MAREADAVWERLNRYFIGVVTKRLSRVEADLQASNQHEFNGTVALKDLLGADDCKFKTTLVRLADDHVPVSRQVEFTWYESRKPPRSEYRLYFPKSEISEEFREGDVLAIGRRRDNSLVAITAPAGSTAERQMLWLFGADVQAGFQYREISAEERRLRLAAEQLLEDIGIELEPDHESETDADRFLRKFAKGFPSSQEVSDFCRACVKNVDAKANPDETLLTWLTHEEAIFKHAERREIEKRLKAGFTSVEDFLEYSLSIQNRRKARAGRALENHLEQVFCAHGVSYTRGGRTEGKSRPDFLFPGEREYHDSTFPESGLFMLGAKTTCKDRWRQVLAEAKRIERKHLLTLEPGISETQTDEMEKNKLQLVVPSPLQTSYSEGQRERLQSLAQFLLITRKNQGGQRPP